ncbi:MAG: DUF1800 family protein [Anaerolineae bacterium]|jgi:uncharacterized protein (DUF1800 family)|nr:DUF1800 family protein [Anaerolineae bacterium]MBT7073508.1 DUF1800 family protein [Anaerolineae bacterium]MBT7782488.1 DUF1800 family protein [Anaerolineae bacterium]
MTRNLSRRDFLKSSGFFAAAMALSACQPSADISNDIAEGSLPELAPAPDLASVPPTNEALLLHTLKRISFSVTPTMLARAREIGLDAYIEEQLFPEKDVNSEIETYIKKTFKTLNMTPTARFELERFGQPIQEMIGATLVRQWRSSSQFYEVMVDFWSNHFNIFLPKNLCRVLKADDDRDVIRANAFGKFYDLLSASAHSPAMLVYLDQASSNKGAPNENYARELLELHTVGVNGGYNHEDISELARALTGWSVTNFRDKRREAGQFVFRAQVHDDGQKQVLGTVVPAGGGQKDGERIIEMLSQHPQTAEFISTKLARRFVVDNPPTSLISKLSQVFSESEGDTREMMRVLLKSDEFKASLGQKFKRPIEFFISAMRVTDAKIKRTPRALTNHLRQMGQTPFFWSPPTGYPDYADWWTTTSGILNRWNFALALTKGEVQGVEVDLQAFVEDAASAQDVVDLLSIRFLGEKLPDNARDILIDYAGTDIEKTLPEIAGLILGSPHFQVR